MKSVIVYSMLLFVFAGVSTALDLEDYLPFDIGNSWTTRDSSSEGIDTTVSEIVDTTTMAGHLTYIFEDRNPDETDTTYMQLRSDGLYNLDSEEPVDSFIRIIPNPVDYGDVWSILYQDSSWVESPYTYYQHIEINGEAIGPGMVIVPAGSFPNCLKVAMTGEWNYSVLMGPDTVYSGGGQIGENSMWLAQGVGPVKFYNMEIDESDTSIDISVLIEYNLTRVAEFRENLPAGLSLKVSPNPFNSACAIVAPAGAEIEIFDVNGRRIDVIASKPAPDETIFGNEGDCRAPRARNDGEREYIWQPGEDIGSGVYLVRAKTYSGSVAKRIILLK